MNLKILSYFPDLYTTKRLLQEAHSLSINCEIIHPEDTLPVDPNCAYLLRLGRYRFHELISSYKAFPAKFYNSLASFELARNKWQTYLNLHADFKLPKTQLNLLPFPFVAKKTESLKGEGVFLVRSEPELNSLLAKDDDLIFQEYFPQEPGVDYRLLYAGDTFVGAIQRKNPHDFRANIAQGATASPWTPPNELIQTGQKIQQKLGLFYCGLDFILGSNNSFYFIEANASPGFEAFEKSTQLNYAKILLEKIKSDF